MDNDCDILDATENFHRHHPTELKIKLPQHQEEKMPPVEHPITDDNVETSEQECQEQTISRRKLLKVLAATGGTVTVTMLLPNKWAKPVVEVGVLPVHAQATDTPLPTDTPIPAIIITCSAANVTGATTIGPSDTIVTYAEILPATGGIELRRTITLNQAGHPQDGVVATDTGVTNASGRFQAPNFDLSTLSPTISTGVDRIIITWEFVNPSEGTGTCTRNIEIV